MKHSITPNDLLNNPDFELIEEVGYSNLKPFIMNEIGKKSLIIQLYGILQFLSILIFIGLLLFFIYGFFKEGIFIRELLILSFSVIFSFTIMIPLHELIHAAAFLLLGKRDIGFGVQWKKYLFYAESNRQVLNRKEMIIVALAPFLFILTAGLGCFFFSPSKVVSLSGLLIVLLHFLFCGGDFAIISFFNRNKPFEVYTFDDRKLKTSYYFKRTN